ncbi:hypothetical protein [Luteimonas aquatica]|uniref:hypothetical protein n=1 Tax=Luteimonas aquatica TaxID=450364 RepID=UPI001F55C920|nr:hypothetical protein [Luteimonas aquatica]
MNLTLHYGWLGVLEAGGIAFAIGAVFCLIWRPLCRLMGLDSGHVIGWAGFAAVIVAAGIDLRHLVSLFFVNPGSPAYAQQALANIHDPDRLGARVLIEMICAFSGVVLVWLGYEHLGKRRG